MAAKRRRCAVLPDHLIEEIFLRLPLKSLIRCRCVSRAWAATLVDCYYHVANLHGGPRICGVQDLLAGHEPKVLAPLTTTPRVITIDSFPRLATELPSMEKKEEESPIHPIAAGLVTSQCRGLVIVTASPVGEASRPDMSFVCNPTTGQMAALPEGRTTGCLGSVDHRERYERLGLGYDVHTRKHKVVRIYYRGRGLSSPAGGCEVYDVNGATGMWRPTGEKPTGWIDVNTTSVFAQGHVYWLAYRELYPRCQELFIMSFSLRDEKLRTIKPPPLDMDNMTPDLTELGGRLCLFAACECRYDIWQLNQYGSGGATWDPRYRIDVAPEAMPLGANPLSIIDDGRRILLAGPSPDQIYAFDPLTKETENLLDWSMPDSSLGIIHAAVYKESIASPGQQPCKDTILISSPSTQALWLVLQLQCLPQCTIGRLMCVCRSWHSMICCQYGS